MKKKLLLWSILLCIFTFGNAQGIDANGNIIFLDVNFKNALLDLNAVVDIDGDGLLESTGERSRVSVDTNGDGEINVIEAEAVIELYVSNQDISDLSGIEKFAGLERLFVNKNELTSINISDNLKLRDLFISDNLLTQIDVSSNILLEALYARRNNLTGIDVSSNSLLSTLVLSNNREITNINVTENSNLTHLELNGCLIVSIIDVTENEGLEYLDLSGTNITNIDVTRNLNLTSLNLLNTRQLIPEINLTNNTLLGSLSISGAFANLDLSANINLTSLLISSATFTSLDLSTNNKLKHLFLWSNRKLTDLDLSSQTNLTEIDVRNSELLTSLDFRPCKLTEIDFRGSTSLQTVFMTGQPLEYKTNTFDEEILQVDLFGCPNLQFMCAEQEYLNDIYSLLEDAEQTSCLLSNDCDDPHNRIQGDITYDVDNNGCGGTDDVAFTGGLRYSAISLSTGDSYVTYPNNEGQYTLHIADDTYFLGPALENFEYFGFSEPVLQAPTTIPAQLAGLTTDYCIQPLGIFNDLEIAIYPINEARPGFTASYIIRYKNRGTTTQSGTITLDYEEDVLEYVSSTPGITSNSNGQLIWEFNDLLPSAIVELPLTLRLNTPTDSPALNGGDILDFVATITGATDETPEDNVMELAQLVVNSYDPNDKTCLEGDILDPDDVGGYLHYLIRFENEGTANAINVRVTDVIDTTKFDIETFEPISSSHSVSTTITNGSEIEFMFNNINLPFDDENNDGYVVFKIRTLDTLVEGDEIVNGAAIYFDYNFPVITENSVVEVKREEVSEPGFSDYFTLSPNPTTGIMNLTVLDDSIAISYILIYDMGGNLVGYYFGTTRTMNVSYLFPNSYIMQIFTDKGELSTQFIKL